MSPHEAADLRDPAQLDLAIRVGASWIRLRRGAVMSVLRELLLGTDEGALEQGQFDTLDLLASKPAWRMSEVAEALRVDPSTATRAVQRLVSSGLATRMAHDDDGRVVMVAITEVGRARHDVVAVRRAELMQHILNAFTAAERPVLAEFMERFVASVDSFIAEARDSV